MKKGFAIVLGLCLVVISSQIMYLHHETMAKLDAIYDALPITMIVDESRATKAEDGTSERKESVAMKAYILDTKEGWKEVQY